MMTDPRESKKCPGCGKRFYKDENGGRAVSNWNRRIYCNSKCYYETYRKDYARPADDISPASVGASCELLVSSDLLMKGFSVFRSVSPAASYDLIAVGATGEMFRIEVRRSHRERGGKLRFPVKKDEMSKCDVFALVTSTEGIYYVGDGSFCTASLPEFITSRGTAGPDTEVA